MITREVTKDDIDEIVTLTKLLKLKSKEADIRRAFSEIINRKDHTLIACVESDSRIVGYIHGLIRVILGNPMSVEVGGILIQHEYRGKGLGTLLIKRVEEWAKQNQINVITLASSVQRKNAHNFYIRNGYSKYRDRHHFIKEL